MSADTMPPLPAPEAMFSVDDSGKWREARSGTAMWTEDAMHAYARAYAAEQTRELVEALKQCADYTRHPDYDWNLEFSREISALIAKHKEQA